jgi:hypothetical protein
MKTAEEQVRDRLPGVLIDYLWTLASEPIKTGAFIQTFDLSPVRLGGELIQEIQHQATPCAVNHRVYGFPPVTARLRVVACEDSWHMAWTA